MQRLIYILLAGLLCTACADDIQDEVTVGKISGVVLDKTTGEPVATVSAVLSPGGNSTVTGSDGSFEFVDLSPGEYTVNINKEGYKDNNKVVTVVAGQTTQAHLLIERIPAVITADRTELDFGKDYSVNTLSFNIVNNSYEKLSWKMVDNCRWITEVSPISGSLDYGKTGTIVVKIDRNLLADGDNTAILVLSTEGRGSVEITVEAYGNKASNEYIILEALGLAVQRKDIGYGTRSSMSSLCGSSRVGGYTDWRLPTIGELSGIYQYREQLNGSCMMRRWEYKTYNYWSSSSGEVYIQGSGWKYQYYYLSCYNNTASQEATLYTSDQCYALAVRTFTE